SRTRGSISWVSPARSGWRRSGWRRRRRSDRPSVGPWLVADRRCSISSWIEASNDGNLHRDPSGAPRAMKLAYFDCPAGASGDMILGALTDAGCPLGAPEQALQALEVPGWRLAAETVERGGLRGTRVVVETDPAVRFHGLADLLAPIKRSALADSVKARASSILTRLAEAESRVHRVPVEAVHFHEVGALDTLVDVVGAVAGLDALGIGAVHVSAFPLRGGARPRAPRPR